MLDKTSVAIKQEIIKDLNISLKKMTRVIKKEVLSTLESYVNQHFKKILTYEKEIIHRQSTLLSKLGLAEVKTKALQAKIKSIEEKNNE